MDGIREYFRVHRWQRRMLTVMVAAVLGASAALLAYEPIRDRLLIRRLGSDSPDVRRKAIERAFELANVRTAHATRRRLNEALATDDDRRFSAIAIVLDNLGMFQTPDRDPVQIDRKQAIDLATAAALEDPQVAISRGAILTELILCGRDNRYVRRAASVAAEDKEPALRELAAVLAARIGDDATLRKLMSDRDPGVVAAAALDAGLAGRETLGESIMQLLETSGDTEAVSSAAYATALLRGRECSTRLCALLKGAEDEALRDRLLHVMTLLKDAPARAAVLEVLEASGRSGRWPPAVAILAAGKLRIEQAGPQVQGVLAAATEPDSDLEVPQVHAALGAADALELPVQAEVHAICDKLWRDDCEPMMVAAVRLLGKLINMPRAPDTEPPTREDMIEMLQDRAVYEGVSVVDSTESAREVITTPTASAAAAVALWLAEPQFGRGTCGWFVRCAAESEDIAAGDYIAWHIGRAGGKEAFALGLEMLPPLDAPAERKEFNDNVRAAGAMLLALSAETELQRKAASERITSRLEGGRLGGEDRPRVIWSYESALLILGQQDRREKIRFLLGQAALPPRRGITALCAASDRWALDWLLWNSEVTMEAAISMLLEAGVGEVLRAAAPELPAVDDVAGPDLRQWQLRILQEHYAIHRNGIRPELSK